MGISAIKIPTSAEGTVCSAQAISEKGITLPVRLSIANRGSHSRPISQLPPRQRHTHHMTRAPIPRRPQTMNTG